jgi:hypothetical protein
MDTAPRVTRSGSQVRQRNNRPALCCTDAEFAQLQLNAERAGMTVSSYMRHQCLGTAGPRAARRPRIEQAVLAQILGHIGKGCSNLNQRQRVLNSGGDDAPGVAETLADLRSAAGAIMQALGRTPHDH